MNGKRVFLFGETPHAGNKNGAVLVSGAPGGGVRVEITSGASFREVDPADESMTTLHSAMDAPVSGNESDLIDSYVSSAALRKAAMESGMKRRVSVVDINGKKRQVWPEFGAGEGKPIDYAEGNNGAVNLIGSLAQEPVASGGQSSESVAAARVARSVGQSPSSPVPQATSDSSGAPVPATGSGGDAALMTGAGAAGTSSSGRSRP